MLDRATKDGQKLVVTFDFDETMTIPEWDEKSLTWKRSMNPNLDILDEMCRLHHKNWIVCIMTERYKIPNNMQAIRQFYERHNLPVKRVFYTHGRDKFEYIKETRSSLHYDDDLYELRRLPSNVTGILVPTVNSTSLASA